MKGLPYRKPKWATQQVKRASGLIEDVCKHGVGHPNVDWLGRHDSKGIFAIHGCCQYSCCCSDEVKREMIKKQLARMRETIPCEKCGKGPIEFHSKEHDDRPHKRISSLVNRGSVKAVWKEIDKSQKLCRSCHMKADGRLKRLCESAPNQRGTSHPPKKCKNCGELHKPSRKGMCYQCYEYHREGGRNYKGHIYSDGCCHGSSEEKHND